MMSSKKIRTRQNFPVCQAVIKDDKDICVTVFLVSLLSFSVFCFSVPQLFS